ncbi:ABC transporter six-transmembrane domain-containing protein [Cognataquiflexum aquatile]|uniref:ABC transporter six-transmembrane domain-containing protein n=1 Tax=Cognataquiflexum aquatile TaxID=2249427 RepID=UPI000DEADBE1|nr:ABC transporter six-transmembrane domain-containing protein [Cognataquiflexum aquatile]
MKKIFLRFKNRLSVTFGLLILESIGELLFPLVIGFAIDDLLNKSYEGLFQLSILGFFTILIGAVRRLIDSRFYGYIFVNLGTELAKSQSKLSPSKKSAQLSLLNEIVEFLENSMPSLFTYVVGLFGTMFILFKLNLPVAIGCLISSFITLGVYIATSSKTTRLNSGWNDEFEKRVDVMTKNNDAETVQHLQRFMKWNIRLSDLETVNYSLAWLTAIGLLVFTVMTTSIESIEYGAIFSVVMYVYQFIEGYTEVPLHYQEWLRLREISSRINISLAQNKG